MDAADGRSNFRALLFNRRALFFCTFDALDINGEDLRGLPQLERKRRLFDVMPRIESRVRYVDYVHERGIELFDLACQNDLEGIVAKYARGTYLEDRSNELAQDQESRLQSRSRLFDDEFLSGILPSLPSSKESKLDARRHQIRDRSV